MQILFQNHHKTRDSRLEDVVAAVGGQLHILPIHNLHLLSSKLTIDEHTVRRVAKCVKRMEAGDGHCGSTTHDDL